MEKYRLKKTIIHRAAKLPKINMPIIRNNLVLLDILAYISLLC